MMMQTVETNMKYLFKEDMTKDAKQNSISHQSVLNSSYQKRDIIMVANDSKEESTHDRDLDELQEAPICTKKKDKKTMLIFQKISGTQRQHFIMRLYI